MSQTKSSPKVLLIIMDGWGLSPNSPGNAIAQADTPTYSRLMDQTDQVATLEASGEAVGLPPGQMGTSEVNHYTIGAGRIVYQDLVKINRAVDDGSFGSNPAFQQAFAQVKEHDTALHLIGLVSDGGVHSHLRHLKALLTAAKDAGLKRVYVHVITDGRDVLPRSASQYVQELTDFMDQLGLGEIATISGRYYAMDRDHNWDRTNLTFEVISGDTPADEEQPQVFDSAQAAITASYQQDISDEFIKPAFIRLKDGSLNHLQDYDSVIFANFRNDRPRQLTERLLSIKDQDHLCLVTMTNYNPEYQTLVAFGKEQPTKILGEILADHHRQQLRITETEKFAHLTFFFNAKREEAFEGEDRFMYDSYSDIKTHDERPEMRAPDIAERIIIEMEQEKYDFIATNFPNADMVGHTSNIPATIKGVEAVDQALSKILPAAKAHGYDVIITADHGNGEQMLGESGEKLTAHTLNPVPFILISARYPQLNRHQGLLIDVAPTILKLLDLPEPPEMTGESFV